MERLVAFCGLFCNECPAYIATQADDQEAKDRLLAEWRVAFNTPDMPLDAVTCDGCATASGRRGGYCHDCAVRACGVAHGVANCAHCTDYSTCETLNQFVAGIPQARAVLEEIRLSLA